MKLNLDNKYHCQLPRAGETRRQRPLTRHRAHSRAPRDRGLHHLRDPAPTIGVFPAGVEPATQTGRFTSPGGGGSTQHSPGTKDVSPGSPRAGLLRTTQRSSHVPGEPQGGAPRTTSVIPCPREAPGRGSKDHIGHPMSPGSPRAGLLRTTQRSSHVPREPQGGAPEDHISHPMSPGSPRAGLRGPQRSAMAWGPFQSRLWAGGGCLAQTRLSSRHTLGQAAHPPLLPPQASDNLGGEGSQGSGKAARQETGRMSRPREWGLMRGQEGHRHQLLMSSCSPGERRTGQWGAPCHSLSPPSL